jgi:hypothetical protein
LGKGVIWSSSRFGAAWVCSPLFTPINITFLTPNEQPATKDDIQEKTVNWLICIRGYNRQPKDTL